VLKGIARGLAWAIGVLLTLWAAAALFFDVRVSWLRAPSALVYLALVGIVYLRVRPRVRAHATVFACFLFVLAWWRSLEPSNDRDWQPDVAVLAHADPEGDKITIHDIRNCVYRSETDFDVRRYDKTFDLSKLETVDLYLVYWGSPSIAHTMVSFGFGSEGYICVSIETRKEKGEGYSALRGFFRQYELTYVVADERDLVKLRTDFRHEDVYLYRLVCTPGVARGLFLEYMNKVDALYAKPEWYNAATSNCTTNIRTHAKLYAEDSPWDWRFLVNGHLDQLLWERGRIDASLPFEESRARAYVNPLAQATDGADDFSERIRARLANPSR
jgi:Domain of unknown function (DUF4105)